MNGLDYPHESWVYENLDMITSREVHPAVESCVEKVERDKLRRLDTRMVHFLSRELLAPQEAWPKTQWLHEFDWSAY